jgi:hypothetical protein
MANESVMRRYTVPGEIVKEWIIPAREYSAFTIRRGQTLRFVDIEGKQVPDLVCFNENDLTEYLNMGNSLLLNKRRELRQGDVLYSVICNPMMTIAGYSNEESYAYGPMCSEELNRIRYGVAVTTSPWRWLPMGSIRDKFPTPLCRSCGWRSSRTVRWRSKSRPVVQGTSTISGPKWTCLWRSPTVRRSATHATVSSPRRRALSSTSPVKGDKVWRRQL